MAHSGVKFCRHPEGPSRPGEIHCFLHASSKEQLGKTSAERKRRRAKLDELATEVERPESRVEGQKSSSRCAKTQNPQSADGWRRKACDSIVKEQATPNCSVTCSIADSVQNSRYYFWPGRRRAGRATVGHLRGRETAHNKAQVSRIRFNKRPPARWPFRASKIARETSYYSLPFSSRCRRNGAKLCSVSAQVRHSGS
jgi:hypothetical protein